VEHLLVPEDVRPVRLRRPTVLIEHVPERHTGLPVEGGRGGGRRRCAGLRACGSGVADRLRVSRLLDRLSLKLVPPTMERRRGR
jgi:hypothetical protein